MTDTFNSARSDRPNLEKKRKLAKELLKAVKRLETYAAARFTWNHPRFRGKKPQDVIREGVTLSEAQHVVARESGFDSWPKLKEYVQLLDTEPDGPMAAFENAVNAIIRGHGPRLRTIIGTHPEVVTMRSRRQHHCVLPHYIAANGVENEHQIVPPNAPEIARILFEAGGDQVVDATAGAYGGGPGSTPLVALVSSSHPHEAGVQAELVRIFCEAGANVNGIENDGLPMSTALGFRYPKAAEALAACGASIDNLPTAAGLGRDDLVQAYLDESKRLVSSSCLFPNPQHQEFPSSVAPHPASTLQQALIFACMGGHATLAKRLLDCGVDPNGGPRRGVTALHEACYQGHAEIVHLLLQHGADPLLRDDMWNSTAVGWAHGGNQSVLLEWLLENSNVDILDAIELRRYEVVRRMLEADSSLANAPHGEGATLRIAASQGDVPMARLLLEFASEPTLRDSSGHTAIDYAEKAGHRGVLALLRGTPHSETEESIDDQAK